MFVRLNMYHWQCIQVKGSVNENALFGILRQAAVWSSDLDRTGFIFLVQPLTEVKFT